MLNKPYSQACENNKKPIARVLHKYLKGPADLLEIGSGTGQHAYYFSEIFPEIIWHSSDQAKHLSGIIQWTDATTKPNFKPPFLLDVLDPPVLNQSFEYVFSANTAHIMSWEAVIATFQLVAQCLHMQGLYFLYGPFNYAGTFTSQSNARFDAWLRQQAPHQAIRDFEAVQALATQQGLSLIQDHTMPANNRLLVWKK